MVAKLFIVFQLLAAALAKGNDLGVFWQITDIHYDANYSVTGNVQMNRSHGKYGDYLCDSPWALVSSGVDSSRLTRVIGVDSSRLTRVVGVDSSHNLEFREMIQELA
ncbi:hypothetical protein LSAT2_010299 [Lamellibrachia satsuma]|nr:hypothetical protein LSAT2_010299 [Lamellibrachia satsuma]